MTTRAIIAMAIGPRYRRLASLRLQELRRLSEWWSARLFILDAPLDPSGRHSILVQKLLIPNAFKHVDEIALVDLDVRVGCVRKSPFDSFPAGAALSATVDERDSLQFNNVAERLWVSPELAQESHDSYFESRGFDLLGGIEYQSINSGVVLVRPHLIAEHLHAAYWSNLEVWMGRSQLTKSASYNGEEPVFAYVSQTLGAFSPLSSTFNRQVIYEAFSCEDPGLERFIRGSLRMKVARRLEARGLEVSSALYPLAYRRLVSELLASNAVVHFAGQLPLMGRFQNGGISAT